MICSKCGLATSEGFRFCPRCGASLVIPVKIDKAKLKGPREEVLNAIRKHESTDREVPPLWIWVMFFVYLIWIVSSTVIAFSVALGVLEEDPYDPDYDVLFNEMKDQMTAPILFGVAFYGLAAALTYTIISKMNRHYDRDDELRAASRSLISAGTSTASSRLTVGGDLTAMDRTDDMMASQQRKLNPILWSSAVALPLVISILQWIVMYSSDGYSEYQDVSLPLSVVIYLSYIPVLYLSYTLTKNIFDHHYDWADFANQTSTAVCDLGLPPMNSYMGGSIPRRSFGVYLLVTIITAGFFMFYWWYSIIKDLNHHFKAHRYFEDELARSVR